MRIIIESTVFEPEFCRSVEISVPRDDLDIFQVAEDLLQPALIAFGFTPNTVAELFGDLDDPIDYDLGTAKYEEPDEPKDDPIDCDPNDPLSWAACDNFDLQPADDNDC